jgi:hypothetical protein
MLLGQKWISTAAAVLALASGVASAQAPVMNTNQATANAVASTLKSSRNLSSYRIEIEAQAGVVTLSGSVSSPAQKQEAIELVRRVAGVSGVVDQIRLADTRVRPAQYQVAMGGGGLFHRGGGSAPMMEEGSTTMAPAADGSPIPEGAAGGPGHVALPNQPNYAWPSYAPTGNFSAVGYPTAYPWQAWPNIGPFYPYPEVPQDWRAVTLRWDDGIWWLDFKKNYTRPFFTPYPFGLFAY